MDFTNHTDQELVDALAAIRASVEEQLSAETQDVEALESAEAEINGIVSEIDSRATEAARLEQVRNTLQTVLATDTVEVEEEVAAPEATEEVQEEETQEETVTAEDDAVDADATVENLGQDEVIEDASEGLVKSIATGHTFTEESLHQELSSAFTNRTKGTKGEVIWVGSVKSGSKAASLDSTDTDHNRRVLADLTKAVTTPDGLKASCACVSYDPIRDYTSYCNATPSFTLPKIGAPRGGLCVTLSEEACGLEVEPFEWSEECDPEVPNPEEKPCQTFDCGTEEKALVSAFGWCFEYSNGKAQFDGEHLAFLLGEAQCKFEKLCEKRNYDTVTSHPRLQKEACTAAGAGLHGDLFEIISVKAAAIRALLCNKNLRLEVTVPCWVANAIALDSIRRGTNSTVASIEAALNVNISEYTDPAALDIADCTFPDTADVLITAPGAFVEVDGGELNFGLMRDSVLNAKNKVRLAYEKWTTVLFKAPSCAAVLVTIDGLCANGATGPRIDACA